MKIRFMYRFGFIMDIGSFFALRYNEKEEYKLGFGEINGQGMYQNSVRMKLKERMPNLVPEMKLFAGLSKPGISVFTGLIDSYFDNYYKDCSIEGFRQYLLEPKNAREAILKKFFDNTEMEKEAVLEQLAFDCEIGEPYRSLLFAYFQYPERFMERILAEVDRVIACLKQIYKEYMPRVIEAAKHFSYQQYLLGVHRYTIEKVPPEYQEIWVSFAIVNSGIIYQINQLPIRVLILGVEYEKYSRYPLPDTVPICHALGDEVRAIIFGKLICAPGSTINEIIESSGKARNTVVHHMEALKNANLVKVRQQGKKTMFYPNKKVMEEYIQMMQCMVNDME